MDARQRRLPVRRAFHFHPRNLHNNRSYLGNGFIFKHPFTSSQSLRSSQGASNAGVPEELQTRGSSAQGRNKQKGKEVSVLIDKFVLHMSSKSESLQTGKMRTGLSQQDAEKEKENIIQRPQEETGAFECRNTKFCKANNLL